MHTPISRDLMGIRWDDIGNLSKNLHNTTQEPQGPKESSRGPLQTVPNMPTNIANFAIFGYRTLQNPYVVEGER